MYHYNYGPRGYNVSFRRSFGYAMGHTIARAIVEEGSQKMHKMIENRHRIIDAEFTDVEPSHMRWQRKHAQFGSGDFSRAANQPRSTRVNMQPTFQPYPIRHKTPWYKIAFWMTVGALAFFYFGTDYFIGMPKDVVGYYYKPDGTKLCYMRNTTGKPSEWDSWPVLCPGKNIRD